MTGRGPFRTNLGIGCIPIRKRPIKTPGAWYLVWGALQKQNSSKPEQAWPEQNQDLDDAARGKTPVSAVRCVPVCAICAVRAVSRGGPMQ
ncbi:uncharacterized protein SPSK_01313 [Sporothrix schenckii 1099-18]|uniref:Uncharacterized protein n=1 Tax=Sporothrix schenckii 1099-18 TaxID=1397361 RepID=A0A0F2LXZ9_SPOSC|nr:uncharacterized protein SPSK_01313 [Sporothrix schenckii 1099-18]KJR81365.1 hypothetical protein SPSK_01313 [Sporothrix schenckii 1099-18]